MYNLNKHNNYNYLKDYLGNFVSNNFDEFLKEANSCADVISNSISESNYSVYGFNYFDKHYYPDNLNVLKSNIKNKVIGDIFELFAGFFVQYFETESTIGYGIKRGSFSFGGDLNQNFDETDLGMDGYGSFAATNANAVLQVKYRSNPKDRPFTKHVFDALFVDAIRKRKLLFDNTNSCLNTVISDQRMYFFTNIPIGSKSSWDGKTKQFNDCCETFPIPSIKIGYNEITHLVGSKKKHETNKDFWNTFYQQFKEIPIKNTISW